MTTAFSKTDLAFLLALPLPTRALGLLAALRFLDANDMGRIGADASILATLVTEGLLLRLSLQRRLLDAVPVEVFALSRRGARALAQALSADPASVPSSTRQACNRSAMFLDHTLARNRLALLLGNALQGDVPARLLSWEHDADRLADAVPVLRGPNHLERLPLVADGLAVVEGPRGAEGLLIEIDRGTERPGYLGRKYGGYLAWWRGGGSIRRFSLRALRLLTVAPDAKRTDRLRATAIEVTSGVASGLFWFASEDDLVREGITAAVWSTTRREGLSLWS